MYSVTDDAKAPGCPIQKSTDQRVLSPPRSLSQLVASFIASESQGIHRLLLLIFYSILSKISKNFTHHFNEFVLEMDLHHQITIPTISKDRKHLLVENIGVEPMTSCVQGRRSSQLS